LGSLLRGWTGVGPRLFTFGGGLVSIVRELTLALACCCKLVVSLGVRLRNSSQPDHPMLSSRVRGQPEKLPLRVEEVCD
jgi:hypothetical protein